MGFKDLWDKITGQKGPKLTHATGEIPIHMVEHLAVSTAEALVIIELSAHDVARVIDIAQGNSPVGLRAGETTAIFVPTDREALPVKDPKKGWIIPLSTETANKLEAQSGDYEINNQIAFVVI